MVDNRFSFRAGTARARTGISSISPLEFVNALIGAPSARWLPASESLWRAFEHLIDVDRAIKGNLVPNAYIAAAAIAHGARLVTADRGFARFSGLTWFDPANGNR